MKVTEISDVAALIVSNENMRDSFNTTFDTIAANVLKDVNATTLRDKCGRFANTLLKNYSFNRKDSSFIFGYVAQDAFPGDLDLRLDCIGNKYNAKDIVDFGFPYNVDKGALRKLTLPVIEAHFDHTPLSSAFARPYANSLANLLGVYLQSADSSPRKEEARRALASQIANPVRLEDESKTIAINDSDVTPDQLISNLNDAGYRRFGCIFLKPTVGAGAFDMIMLALPLKAKSNNVYEIEEIVGLRLVVDVVDEAARTGVLKRIQVTNDESAVFEAATENKGKCARAAINIANK